MPRQSNEEILLASRAMQRFTVDSPKNFAESQMDVERLRRVSKWKKEVVYGSEEIRGG